MRSGRMMAAALLVVAALGCGWWIGRTHGGDAGGTGAARVDPGPPAEVPAGRAQVAAGSARNTSAALPDRSSPVPLPALDVPLRASLPELQRRATAGEAKAHCRLAAEYAYCERQAYQLAGVERMLGRQPPPDDVLSGMPDARREAMLQAWRSGADRARARAETLLAESAHCEGVAAPGPQAIARHWGAAALRGHRGSMRHYAVGNAFRLDDTLRVLPELGVYRREAEAVARRAADAGDLPVTLALAYAYLPDKGAGRRPFLAQVVGPDGTESMALYLRVQRTLEAQGGPSHRPALARIEARLAQLAAGLTPGQRALAQQKAARGAVVIEGGAVPAGAVMRGMVGDIDRAACDA